MSDKQDLRPLYDAMAGILADVPLMEIGEFDEAAEEQAKKLGYKNWQMSGRRRSRNKNLGDWVKAWLTRQDMITYLRIGAARFIAYLPPCGVVGGSRLCYWSNAHDLLGQIAIVCEERLIERIEDMVD